MRTALPGLAPRRAGSCRGAEDLEDLLAGEAAYVAQKTTVEFCRLRAGCDWSRLFAADEFRGAMERSRWRAFLAVLGDVGEIAQIVLRRHGADATARPERLGPVLRRALLHHGAPPIPGDWVQVGDELEARLARALLAAPRPVHILGQHSGPAVFAALPFTTNLGGLDREHVVNAVRFALCGVYARMEERMDVPALAAALEAEPLPAT